MSTKVSNFLKNHPIEIDPVVELAAYLEEKTASIRDYSRKPDRNEAYLNRLIDDYERLEEIYNNLESLQFYSVWLDVEEQFKRFGSDIDGANIMINMKDHPIRFDRLMNLNYGRS
jgi:hypothetical protein